jgi:hypothetical protein
MNGAPPSKGHMPIRSKGIFSTPFLELSKWFSTHIRYMRDLKLSLLRPGTVSIDRYKLGHLHILNFPNFDAQTHEKLRFVVLFRGLKIEALEATHLNSIRLSLSLSLSLQGLGFHSYDRLSFLLGLGLGAMFPL